MEKVNYKIGQKVRSIKSGQEFYIVGIKTYCFPCNGINLLIHEEKGKASRYGKYVSPSQVEAIE